MARNEAIFSLATLTPPERERLANYLAGTGGGGGGGGPTDPDAIHVGDAAGGDLSGTYPNPTVSAVLQAVLLDRANHTGRWYAPKYFPYQLTGPVWYGAPNNTRWRLLVDDADSSVPIMGLETMGTQRSGDLAFANSGAGLVLTGRINGTLCRLTVDDTATDMPFLVSTALAGTGSVTANDYWLAQGNEMLLRGRTADANGQYRWWNFWLDDTDTTYPNLNIERFAV